MDQETIKALIQKYRNQMEFLQGIIRQLETELAEPSIASPQQPNSTGSGATKGDSLATIQAWQFFNKSQPDAAESLLETIGHPLSISELVDGIEKGGLKIGGDTPESKRQNLATVLARSGRFGKAARGMWALPSWPKVTPVKTKSGKDKENGVESEKETTGE